MSADEDRTRALLDAQRLHWETVYAATPGKFGWEPSQPAHIAARAFAGSGARRILELGCGAGRDSVYFSECRLSVDSLDYASGAIEELAGRVRSLGLESRIHPAVHDVRQALPYGPETFDGAFAHMFYNMALSDDEIAASLSDVARVLRSNGLLIYSVRNTSDPDACEGTAISPFLRDVDGDIIRFFSRDCIEGFARGFELIDCTECHEGTLPKRLFVVTLRKAPSF